MVTGRKACEGKSRVSLCAAIIGTDPPAVSGIQQLAPPELDRLIRVCLAKHPEDRWQTARDLLRELAWIAESARGATQASSAARQHWVSRRSWLPWTVAAVASLGFGVLALR